MTAANPAEYCGKVYEPQSSVHADVRGTNICWLTHVTDRPTY